MQKTLLLATGLIILGLFFSAIPVQAANQHYYQDPTGDVMTMDFNGNGKLVTSSPYINISDIDITEATYSDNNAGVATVSLTVAGKIKDLGTIPDLYGDSTDFMKLNATDYSVIVTTTNDTQYTVTYANHTCKLDDGINTTNITDFTVSDSRKTLTMTFPFDDKNEQFANLTAAAEFFKLNFTNDTVPDESNFDQLYVVYEDEAPNPDLALDDVSAETNLASVGKNIQFNCTVTLFSGLPQYTYSWKFGDGATSTDQNPIHAYTAVGDYNYTCTVTDSNHATVSQSGTIKIQSGSGSTAVSSGNMVMIFIAIIVVIVVAGVAIVVYLIRR